MIKSFIGRIMIKLVKYSLRNMSSDEKSLIYDQLVIGKSITQQNDFRKKYDIHESFRFNGQHILFYGSGSITCGSNSYIGNLSTIQADANCKVKIGNNTSISHNVRIYTSTNFADQNLDTLDIKEKKYGDVVIGNGAWIGANVFINPGITIGDNAIIGANSVVTKDIEPNGIYGGVPAKLIKFKTN